MQLHRLVIPVVLLAPLSFVFAGASAQVPAKSTTTTTTTTVITTAVPEPKDTAPEPEGYISCSTVAAGWQDKIWHPEYKVCQYDTEATAVEGEAWVSGHWECTEYTVGADQSECTGWTWSEGRWVKTFAELQ